MQIEQETKGGSRTRKAEEVRKHCHREAEAAREAREEIGRRMGDEE
jgi:hypothetical protein